MHNHCEIIELLGGTAKVAQIFGIKMPSVSRWRKTGIPKARLMYLQVRYPKVFKEKNK
jgi:hypothetical protein